MKKAKRGRPVSEVSKARREFIKRWVIVPEISIAEIAEAVEVSRTYVLAVAGTERLQQREAKHLDAVKLMKSQLPKINLE